MKPPSGSSFPSLLWVEVDTSNCLVPRSSGMPIFQSCSKATSYYKAPILSIKTLISHLIFRFMDLVKPCTIEMATFFT